MEYVYVVIVDAGDWHVLDEAGIRRPRVVKVRCELRCSLDLNWIVAKFFSGFAGDGFAFVVQELYLA